MQEKLTILDAKLERLPSNYVKELTNDRGEISIEVDPDDLMKTMKILKEDPDFSFGQLIDIATVDYLQYGVSDWKTNEASGQGFSRAITSTESSRNEGERRFAVVYHLLSLKNNWRIRVKTFPRQDLKLESVIDIWPSADWFERESFDLFGILFIGHPDLRRLLTDYGFSGHPFRKDFPLEGYTEVRYDPDEKRVISEPVSIEPRTLVPKVIRDS
ncbi:NADH-quinone oxidoreductase subunit C [Pseudomonadota bacterium]|nr:NADH-quinone oxidoreductase subunit C [Pseudomonadota bacterium]